jgi:hypothetical protein
MPQVPDIRVQGAAQHHIDELGPPADAQQRNVMVQGMPDPPDFQQIPIRIICHGAGDLTVIMLR